MAFPTQNTVSAGTLSPTLSWTIPAAALLFMGTIALMVQGTLPLWAMMLPLALSAIFLGLPHGALDHRVMHRVTSAGSSLRMRAAVLAGYLALAGFYLVLWFTAPLIAFALFIVLTWYHWGQGDAFTMFRASHGEYPGRGPFARPAFIFLRGGLPMLVPLVAFPEVFQAVAGWAAAPFGGTEPALARLRYLGWGLMALYLSAVVLYFLYQIVKTPRHARRWLAVDAALVLGLGAYFSLVHPLLSIGFYFTFWHSLRHLDRLRLVLAGPDGSPLELSRVLRAAMPMTFLSLVLLAGLYLAAPYPPGQAGPLLGLYLVLIACLTLPHTVVVCLMDRTETATGPGHTHSPAGHGKTIPRQHPAEPLIAIPHRRYPLS